MEMYDHLSTEGVHSYKCNTVQQEKAVSSLLSGPSKLFVDAVIPVLLQKSSRLQEPAIGKEPPPVMKPPSHIAEMQMPSELLPLTCMQQDQLLEQNAELMLQR